MATFALLLVTMVTLTRSDCIQLHTTKGNKLDGYQYSEFSGSDLMSCFKTCRDHGHCQSINYKRDGSLCELNNRTREASPLHFITADHWLYFNNPFKTLIGSNKSLPGRSCKDIRDSSPGLQLANQEYWIDPGNSMQPFTVYCDMSTDGGGWTLIASTVVNMDNETIGGMIRQTNYRSISNYSINSLRIDVPAIRQLRLDMGFVQLRYFCHKKSVGRTFHIITKKNELGQQVVEYFTEDGKDQSQSCNSYFRGPGDDSILASSCEKWGSDGSSSEIGKWGYYQHNGTYRIYNEPAYWNSHGGKYFINFIPGRLCCDEDKSNCDHLSAGDVWKLFVK
ncbi:hypothetical protein QZH41_018025 [Actinostola sp. cb2023]|nr:hypothetical protein QZH41_018025 [Actinostola sp. cb2023]